jgi:hypothetical protein
MEIWLVKRLVTRLVEARATDAGGLAALFEEANKDRTVLNRLKAIVKMSMLEHRSDEDLKIAQKFATVVINSVYMQQIRITCINSPLSSLWQIIFDWSVPIAVKKNL